MLQLPIKIHHNTRAKAERNGISLSYTPHGGFTAHHHVIGLTQKSDNAKDAVELLVVKINNFKAQLEGGAHQVQPANPTPVKTTNTDDRADFLRVRRREYAKKYRQNGGHCGDDVGAELTAFFQSDSHAYEILCRDNNIDPNRWAHLSRSQQRMNVGNVLRGRWRNGKTIKVDAREMSNKEEN